MPFITDQAGCNKTIKAERSFVAAYSLDSSPPDIYSTPRPAISQTEASPFGVRKLTLLPSQFKYWFNIV
jgi:hypothetical protein